MRKLVLETAKFNVLTAHSTREALDVFHLFPNISGAVLVMGMGIGCNEIATHIKAATDKVPIIFLSSRIGAVCKRSDCNMESGEPEELLERVRALFGDPRQQEEKTGAA